MIHVHTVEHLFMFIDHCDLLPPHPPPAPIVQKAFWLLAKTLARQESKCNPKPHGSDPPPIVEGHCREMEGGCKIFIHFGQDLNMR